MFQVAHDADTKIKKNREKNHVHPQLLITPLLENHNLSCHLSHEKQHNKSFDGIHLCHPICVSVTNEGCDLQTYPFILT